MFTFKNEEIQAYKKESSTIDRRHSNKRAYLDGRQPSSKASGGGSDAGNTRMVELRKPTEMELSRVMDAAAARVPAKLPPANTTPRRPACPRAVRGEGNHGGVPYIELRRPDAYELPSSGRQQRRTHFASNNLRRTRHHHDLRDVSGYSSSSSLHDVSIEASSNRLETEPQDEPLNLSSKSPRKDVHGSKASPQSSALNLAPTQHRRQANRGCQPLLSLSPFRNLRLSDSTSPVPPSPSRKRTGDGDSSAHKVIGEGDDITDFASEVGDHTSSNFWPKLGRYNRTYASPTKQHRPAANRPSQVRRKEHQISSKTCQDFTPAAALGALNPEHATCRDICKSSDDSLAPVRDILTAKKNGNKLQTSSLPCTPQHNLPAKWRLKRGMLQGKSSKPHNATDTNLRPPSASCESVAMLSPPDPHFAVAADAVDDVMADNFTLQEDDRLIVITGVDKVTVPRRDGESEPDNNSHDEAVPKFTQRVADKNLLYADMDEAEMRSVSAPASCAASPVSRQKRASPDRENISECPGERESANDNDVTYSVDSVRLEDELRNQPVSLKVELTNVALAMTPTEREKSTPPAYCGMGRRSNSDGELHLLQDPVQQVASLASRCTCSAGGTIVRSTNCIAGL